MATEAQKSQMKAYYQSHRQELLEWHHKRYVRDRAKILKQHRANYVKHRKAKLEYRYNYDNLPDRKVGSRG